MTETEFMSIASKTIFIEFYYCCLPSLGASQLWNDDEEEIPRKWHVIVTFAICYSLLCSSFTLVTISTTILEDFEFISMRVKLPGWTTRNSCWCWVLQQIEFSFHSREFSSIPIFIISRSENRHDSIWRRKRRWSRLNYEPFQLHFFLSSLIQSHFRFSSASDTISIWINAHVIYIQSCKQR
jgi:hypothetical protein